jgi:hypothetical protein
MSKVQNEEVVEVTETAEVKAPKVAAPVRIVILEDGTQVNFGTRATLLSSFDLETSTIVFKSFSGKIISFVVEGIEAFSDFQKQVYLFGLQTKIRGSLANAKTIEDTDLEVQKQIDLLKEGKFAVRSGDSSEVSLDNNLKAWATIQSGKYPTIVADPKTHWADLGNVVVINEVLSAWNALTPKEKIAARKNAYVVYEKSALDIAELQG